MCIHPMDTSCRKQVLLCSDDGGEIVVTGNKMLKGGDERPLWFGSVGYMEPSSTD